MTTMHAGRPPLQHASVRAAVKAAAGPDLLSVSSLAIPFTFDTSVETVTAAAACVHQLIQEPSNVAALLGFAVGSRMAAFAARVFREAAAAAGVATHAMPGHCMRYQGICCVVVPLFESRRCARI